VADRNASALCPEGNDWYPSPLGRNSWVQFLTLITSPSMIRFDGFNNLTTNTGTPENQKDKRIYFFKNNFKEVLIRVNKNRVKYPLSIRSLDH
jgi:hypothetical protein